MWMMRRLMTCRGGSRRLTDDDDDDDAQFFIEVFVGLPTLAFQGFAFASLLFSFFLFRFLLLFGSFMAHIAHLIAVHMAYVRSSNTLSYICDALCRMPHALFTVGLAFNVVCLSVPSLCLSARPSSPPFLSHSSPPCLSMQITFHMLGKFAQSFCSHNQLLLNF